MKNLQIESTIDGGQLVFKRYDFQIDEGIYSELYSCLFGSESNWWFDDCFDTVSFNVTSRTEIAIKNMAGTSENDINLVKKAIKDDIERFKNKNQNIELKSIKVFATASKQLKIYISLEGFNDEFEFIYNQTEMANKRL